MNCPEDCGPCPDYCLSTYSDTAFDWIRNVTFNTIDNTTGQEGPNSYGNYTSLSTEVEPEATHTLTVTFYSGIWTEYIRAWIDWNQDGTWNNPGESYYLGSGQDATLSINITIPSSALAGSTTMRVIEQWEIDPGPCNPHPDKFGETEDYTIIVLDSSADNAPPSPDPMSFSSLPEAMSTTAVTMTATLATDGESPPVEYQFEFVSGGAGGDSSDWQSSQTYTDDGLSPNTGYSYRVRARDSASPPNVTAFSAAHSATTHECEADADCDDGDPCTTDTCDTETHGCAHECVRRPYGDVFPTPDGDGAAEINDIVCILDATEGMGDCSAVGPTGFQVGDIWPCDPPVGDGPDGAVEVMDLLAILDAANGEPGCPAICPCE